MKTTPKQRRQWREIADAATPVGDGYRVAGQLVGTWKPRDIGIYEDPDLDNDLAFARGPMLDRQRFRNERAWREQAEADSLFAFSARTAITALLDDVAELEAERDALRAEVDRLRDIEADHNQARREAREEAEAARTLRAEIDRLREKVSDMRSERVKADEKHKEEVERLRDELVMCRAALASARAFIDGDNVGKVAPQVIRDLLTPTEPTLRDDLAKLQAQHERDRAEIARMDAALVEARQDLREMQDICAMSDTEREGMRAALRNVPIVRLDDDLLHYVCVGCGARSGMDRDGKEIDEDCKPGCWAHAVDAALAGRWARCEEPPQADRVAACGWAGEMEQLRRDRDGVTCCPACGSTAIAEDLALPAAPTTDKETDHE